MGLTLIASRKGQWE